MDIQLSTHSRDTATFGSLNSLIWLLPSVTALLIALANLSPDRIHFTADAAGAYAVADLLWRGESLPLGGPPASLGGRHPGPLYLYLVSLIWIVSGKSILVAVTVEALLKALAIGIFSALAIRQFYRASHPAIALVASAGVSACLVCGNWWWLLRTPWHSNLMAGWLFWCGILALLANSGTSWARVLYFPACTALALGHSASIPAALVMLVSGALFLSKAMSRTERWVSIGLSVICCLPSLSFFSLYNSPVKIASSVSRRISSEMPSIYAALTKVTETIARTSMESLTSSPLLGLLLAVGCLLGIRLVSRNDASLKFLATTTAGILVAYSTVAVVLGQRLQPHMLHSLSFVALVAPLWITKGVELVTPRKFQLVLGGGLLGVLSFGMLCSIPSLVNNLQHAPAFKPNTLAHAQAVGNLLQRLSEKDSKTVSVKTFDDRSQDRPSAYYFFAGREFYPQIFAVRKMVEVRQSVIPSALLQPSMILTERCSPHTTHPVPRQGFIPANVTANALSIPPCTFHVWKSAP
jgi:hypothetical protein